MLNESIRSEHGLHELGNGSGGVALVVAVETPDDIGPVFRDLVVVGEVTLDAEQDEWPLVALLERVECTVGGAEHELGGFGVLVLIPREVAVRCVGFHGRL